ncbi:cilia- and flagella-associated protein 107 [Discoglossus pictus]
MSDQYNNMNKWSLPGWRIEQKYSNNVLIGNWVEERKQFRKSCLPTYNSSYEIDFVLFPDSQPDRVLIRSITKKMEGLPKSYLLSHHGEPKKKHLVTSYDDHILRHVNSTLPPLRKWDRNSMVWVPERSDYPIQEPPTNFGLLGTKEKEWREKLEPRSVYSASYILPPPTALTTVRYGVAPRVLSSILHPSNTINKNLDLKGRRLLQIPDYPVDRTHGRSLIMSTS